MKYSREQTLERERMRMERKKLRTVHHHLAVFPTKCCKCGREFRFEVGYRVYFDYGIAILIYDYCNECATSRADAYNLFYEETYEEKAE